MVKQLTCLGYSYIIKQRLLYPALNGIAPVSPCGVDLRGYAFVVKEEKMARLVRRIFLIFSVFVVSAATVFAEEITITTYYPSPYGSYSSLQADKLGVGDNNADGVLTSDDVPATSGDLWVSGLITIKGGAPGVNKVLTSDANGLATWETSAAGLTKGVEIFQCPTVVAATNYCANVRLTRNGVGPCMGQLALTPSGCFTVDINCNYVTAGTCVSIGYLVN
jgi:hypothetical protein